MKFIKYLFYNSNLHFLNIKDVIWVKRYEKEEDKNKIPEGHREGPMIIINKSFRKVYGLSCSSNKDSFKVQLYKLKVPANKNGFRHTCYVYLKDVKLINKDLYIRRVGQIDDDTLNRIYKSIYLINKYYGRVKHIPKRKLKFTFSCGDIVKYKKTMYYIHDVNSEYYKCYQVAIPNKGGIKINDKNYSFSYINKNIRKDSKLELLNISDYDFNMKIRNYALAKEKMLLNNNKINIGKLVMVNNSYYLIYDISSNKLLTYRVYLNKNGKKKVRIIICDKSFFTEFEKEELSNNDIYIKKSASIVEMEEIKKIKKNFKYKNKPKKEGLSLPKYKVRCIIMNPDTLDKYIITKREENIITYSNIDNLNKTNKINLRNGCKYEILERMSDIEFKNLIRRKK